MSSFSYFIMFLFANFSVLLFIVHLPVGALFAAFMFFMQGFAAVADAIKDKK